MFLCRGLAPRSRRNRSASGRAISARSRRGGSRCPATSRSARPERFLAAFALLALTSGAVGSSRACRRSAATAIGAAPRRPRRTDESAGLRALGTFAALAGVVLVLAASAGSSIACAGLELDAIAAAIVGASRSGPDPARTRAAAR
jgi:hypothetical protein